MTHILLVVVTLPLLSVTLATGCVTRAQFLTSIIVPWNESRRDTYVICQAKGLGAVIQWSGADINTHYPGIQINDHIGHSTYGNIGNVNYTTFRAPSTTSGNEIVSIIKVTGGLNETQIVKCMCLTRNTIKTIENASLHHPAIETNEFENITIALIYKGSPFSLTELSYEVLILQCLVKGTSMAWKINGTSLMNFTLNNSLHQVSSVFDNGGVFGLSFLEYKSPEELSALLFVVFKNKSMHSSPSISCHSGQLELKVTSDSTTTDTTPDDISKVTTSTLTDNGSSKSPTTSAVHPTLDPPKNGLSTKDLVASILCPSVIVLLVIAIVFFFFIKCYWTEIKGACKSQHKKLRESQKGFCCGDEEKDGLKKNNDKSWLKYVLWWIPSGGEKVETDGLKKENDKSWLKYVLWGIPSHKKTQ